jgi:hypothetical protein
MVSVQFTAENNAHVDKQFIKLKAMLVDLRNLNKQRLNETSYIFFEIHYSLRANY